MGNALLAINNFKGAEKTFRKALSKSPKNFSILNNLAIALKKQGKFKEAIKLLKKAILLRSDNPQLYNNLGRTLMDQGKLEETKVAYEMALSLEPDNAMFKYNLSQPDLMQYNFKNGFKHFENRWGALGNLGKQLVSAKPYWTGQTHKRVYAWAEQGIGDEIMFSSIINSLYNLSESVIVSCDERLVGLFKRSFPKDIFFESNKKAVSEKRYDYHIPIGSLPKVLRHNLQSFKISAPGYLNSDVTQARKLKNKLIKNDNEKLIGLSWFSKSTRDDSADRNISLTEIVLALKNKNSRFVNLQYGKVSSDILDTKRKTGVEVLELSEIDKFNDIDRLASLIQACDLVVTVDNITVHLAGALGVQTKLLAPLGADWRWGRGRSDSYWYDSVEIFRQSSRGDWTDVLARLSKF